jgi:hypothetical protein
VNPPNSDTLPDGVSGAFDPHFAEAVRAFATLFPGPRFGGGALAVYITGRKVVDVWTGWADRDGTQQWTSEHRGIGLLRDKRLDIDRHSPAR